ncbi:MFS transporter [Brevibacterium jeotgali]|uniref:Major Facilitator Superfamily protein n=1 Tax=Brevibacterium jeotgali TaxID=1262550 RepID=A0A2H1L2I7_9MICO|nr:MFS transporter [Brevibacterium jeotgali]TWC02329.1 MFS transporter [Brevibacterium jeotgali]SMY11121.1 Major Facilitator Superfamily protein [Brevibacterium jeotgali]
MREPRIIPGAPSTPSPWAVVVALSLAATSVSFMQTLVVPIQNHLPELLDSTRSATAWVLTISLVAAAVTTPISGRLADLWGKRRVLLVLVILLIVGSLIAALSQGLWWMLVGRALQGVSMGVIAVGISVLGDLPDRRLSVMGIAIVSASLGFGGALGLPLAAWIVQVGDWKTLFWSTAVLGVLNLVVVWLTVPHSPGTGRHVDVIGALGLGVGLSGILIAISQGPVWGWDSPTTLLVVLGGVLVLGVWVVFELRVDEPIVDLRQFALRPVLFTNLGATALGFSFFVMEVAYLQILELPAHTEAGLGLSMIDASMALVPASLAMMAAAPVGARITNRYGARISACLGAFIGAAGYVVTLFWYDAVWHFILASTISSVGVAIAYAAIPTLIMAEVPRTATGSAVGVNALMRSVGTSSGATVTGMVLASQVVVVDGAEVPVLAGFLTTFAFGAIAALACMVLVWLSTGRRRAN